MIKAKRKAKPPTKITLSMIREMISLYEAGWSMRYIARRLDIHRDTVSRYLSLNDIEIRKDTHTGRLSHKEYEQAIFLYTKMGLSCEAVGKILGRSKSTIQYRLARAGVERRSRSESQRVRFKTAA